MRSFNSMVVCGPIVRLNRAPRRPGVARRGFTLIELLVVISITALLMGLLVPALGKARQEARRLLCMSNQRQLALSTYNYMGDFKVLPQPAEDGDIPDADARRKAVWFNAIDPYLPLDQTKTYATAADRNYASYKQDPIWESMGDLPGLTKNDNRTIKMNENLGNINNDLPVDDGTNFRFIRMEDIRKPPSDIVLFFDGRAGDTPSVTTNAIDTTPGGSMAFSGLPVQVGLRHSDGANVTFLDTRGSHVRQAIRQTPTGYQGWFNGTDGGPQALNWFYWGRNGINDNE